MCDKIQKNKGGIVMFFIIQAFLALLACVFFFLLQGYRVLGLCCLGLMALGWFYRYAHKLRKGLVRLVTICLCIGLALFAVTEGFIIHGARGNPEESREYLVVLGAKVNQNGPSMALRDRISAAYDYLTAHPDCTAILSGGQGPNEPMTEAQCMYNELAAMGIDPERLWMEGASTNTWENLKFSRELLKENTGSVPDEIALLSNEFHLFRAGLFARRFGFDAVGVPAPTSLPLLKVNYFIREAAAVWYYLIFGGKIYG